MPVAPRKKILLVTFTVRQVAWRTKNVQGRKTGNVGKSRDRRESLLSQTTGKIRGRRGRSGQEGHRHIVGWTGKPPSIS